MNNVIERFDPCHLWICDGLVLPHAHLKALIDNYRKTDEYCIMSIFDLNDRLIAIGGVQMLRTGVAEPFCIFTKHKAKHVKTLIKSFIKLIHFTESELKIRRLQAPIPVSKHKELRWAEYFGLKNEGTLKAYDPDTHEDCFMMGRVSCQP